MRYNLFQCLQINGSAGPGYSSGSGHRGLSKMSTEKPSPPRWALTIPVCRTRK